MSTQNNPRSNQHKPIPAMDVIGPHILRYWKMQMSDVQILRYLHEKHIDPQKNGLGLTTFCKIRKEMGLIRARQAGETVESITPAMVRLRKRYPKARAREMKSLLFHEENMSVPRSIITSYFAIFESDLVRERKKCRLRRRRFWAAGANDIWAVDQHDKWKRFGLALHTGIDPFVGRIQWIKVWWTNSNPRLILSFYLDSVVEIGAMPLVTQSDPGTENYGIANAHTALRHWHDPSLIGTLQHRWMREKKNVKPEITWSQLRRRFTPGFEDILDEGLNSGIYDPADPVQSSVFRWVFIPWLQRELDGYKDRVNNTAKRADRNKILPHGVPNHIYEHPKEYGVLDFKIQVQPEAVTEVYQLYIPEDDPVFLLVPAPIRAWIELCYAQLGRPTVHADIVWSIYSQILDGIWQLDNLSTDVNLGQLSLATEPALIELTPGLTELEEGCGGYYYMGGVNGGAGLDKSHLNALHDMINEDEPALGTDSLDGGSDEDIEQIGDVGGVWFSDEEEEEVV